MLYKEPKPITNQPESKTGQEGYDTLPINGHCEKAKDPYAMRVRELTAKG